MRGCYWFNHSNIRFSFICLLLYPSRVHLSLSLSLSLKPTTFTYLSVTLYISTLYTNTETHLRIRRKKLENDKDRSISEQYTRHDSDKVNLLFPIPIFSISVDVSNEHYLYSKFLFFIYLKTEEMHWSRDYCTWAQTLSSRDSPLLHHLIQVQGKSHLIPIFQRIWTVDLFILVHVSKNLIFNWTTKSCMYNYRFISSQCNNR